MGKIGELIKSIVLRIEPPAFFVVFGIVAFSYIAYLVREQVVVALVFAGVMLFLVLFGVFKVKVVFKENPKSPAISQERCRELLGVDVRAGLKRRGRLSFGDLLQAYLALDDQAVDAVESIQNWKWSFRRELKSRLSEPDRETLLQDSTEHESHAWACLRKHLGDLKALETIT